MNESLLLALAVLALLLALVALLVAVSASRRASRRSRRTRRAPDLPTDVQGLRGEVHALRAEVSDALRHLSVVRYDAFGDMGGHLSWSLALVDDVGTGVVLTSIHGRSDARTYAKGVTEWSCDQQLSPEEEEAIKLARTG
jgi:uncharacterized protein YlxW (UPF0749 family)